MCSTYASFARAALDKVMMNSKDIIKATVQSASSMAYTYLGRLDSDIFVTWRMV